jgi:hypothetical protein
MSSLSTYVILPDSLVPGDYAGIFTQVRKFKNVGNYRPTTLKIFNA